MTKNKTIKKAIAHEQIDAALTPRFIAELARDIVESPIDDVHKAVFLYAIAQGTFNLDLFDRFLELVSEYRKNLETHRCAAEQEVKNLHQEVKAVSKELATAAAGACQEIQDACTHIEVKTAAQIEKIAEKKKTEKIESIREVLKHKKV